MKIDYIILGQGIAGSFLSYYLLLAGKKVLVIDEMKTNSASRIASGVINPVTGRRIVKTWQIDTLLPFAFQAYLDMSNLLKSDQLITSNVVLDIHSSLQMKNAFEARLAATDKDFVFPCEQELFWHSFFNFEWGIGEVRPTYLINLPKLLPAWRNYLLAKDALWGEPFNWLEVSFKDGLVYYRDICAEKILCCEGIGALNNPYFNALPFAPNKGEALIVSIAELPRDHIYKRGFSLVPWGDEDLFWVGSTYQWTFADDLPTASFEQSVRNFLTGFLHVSYSIKSHVAAIRPANIERRPFIGLHPHRNELGILNGLGTKGCSLAPYFAQQFAQHLLKLSPIDAAVDVQRFF